VSENTAIPENSSSASINPLLSVSQMTKELSPAPKMCSNSIRSIEKLSQIDLYEAKKSLSFGSLTKLFKNSNTVEQDVGVLFECVLLDLLTAVAH